MKTFTFGFSKCSITQLNNDWVETKKNLIFVILVNNAVKFMFPSKILENRRKSQKTLNYTVMPASFFSRQMALHVFVLIWRKGYLTPLYVCLFFFLFTNLFLKIHSIFPPFLKEKNRNKEKYKGFGRHHSIPSVKLKSKHTELFAC